MKILPAQRLIINVKQFVNLWLLPVCDIGQRTVVSQVWRQMGGWGSVGRWSVWSLVCSEAVTCPPMS